MPGLMDLLIPCFQERPYAMPLPRLGHAIIVNNEASEMPGSIEDVNVLEATYKAIGFDVQIHLNCTVAVLKILGEFFSRPKRNGNFDISKVFIS